MLKVIDERQARAKPKSGMDLTRRRLLATTGVALGSGLITGFPTLWAQNLKDVTVRHLATGTAGLDLIAKKAAEDLPFKVEIVGLESDTLTQRVLTQPRSYDIGEIEFYMMKKIYPSGVLQPFPVSRLKYYDQMVPIFKTGRLTPGGMIGQGNAPHLVSFADSQDGKSLANHQTEWVTMIPTNYNADTLGIRPDLVGRPINNWRDLVDPTFKGRASIMNIPSIGIMDAAMVMESLGKIKYGDKGDMTRGEIDRTIDFLIETKQAGQFRTLWKNYIDSVNLMASGEVIIQSMWAPAVSAVRAMGIPCRHQPLQEGYRGAGAGLSLSRNVAGNQLDAVYEYINWYMSGWVGALVIREGYYAPIISSAKQYMSDNEWGYFIEGKPAVDVVRNVDGKVVARAGEVRDGGSFEQRIGNIACWNSVMNEDRYMLQRWNDFVAA
jgi:putative spermidine/putrescine transport system substrate-binding protein